MTPPRFCKACYADLSGAAENRCPICRRRFDPNRPSTYLQRPFPGVLRIMGHLVATTVIGVIAAYAVALHQVARTSGH
jgi:hypothetical protein